MRIFFEWFFLIAAWTSRPDEVVRVEDTADKVKLACSNTCKKIPLAILPVGFENKAGFSLSS